MEELKIDDVKRKLVKTDLNDEIVEYFECECHSQEHLLRFQYYIERWGDIEEDGIYVSVLLSSGTFWQRLKAAVPFLFGYECKYGHWDGTLLQRKDAERLRDLVNRWLESDITEFKPPEK